MDFLQIDPYTTYDPKDHQPSCPGYGHTIQLETDIFLADQATRLRGKQIINDRQPKPTLPYDNKLQ
jgi:hypothetical protein